MSNRMGSSKMSVLICFLLLFWPVFAIDMTLVIDTTVSMDQEITVIRDNIDSVLTKDGGVSQTNNYIIVPFNDPDYLQPIISNNPIEFVASLNRLVASGGGHDCPENSISGIIKALEISGTSSNIFVFTDAYAKDSRKIDEIKQLCATTKSRVVIFLSGSCYDYGDVEVYKKVATSCSGMLFKFEPGNLKQAFRYIKYILSQDWSQIQSDIIATGHTPYTVSVSKYTRNVFITLSGDYPTLDILDPSGMRIDVDKILDTRKSKAIRIRDLQVGDYQIRISSRGTSNLAVYSKREFPFSYGFATKTPRSMKETSNKPLPGQPSYIMVKTANDANILLKSIEVRFDETKNVMLDLTANEILSNFYFTKKSVVFAPVDRFRITVFGKDLDKHDDFNITSDEIESQITVLDTHWTAPKTEILDEPRTVVYGSNVTVVCKIYGYPRPLISWTGIGEEESSVEQTLLEMPYVHLHYLQITNIKNNGSYTCTAVNKMGNDSSTVPIYVHREIVLEPLQIPEDQTIEYGESGKLLCYVNSYPHAEITWFLNGTKIKQDSNVEIEENYIQINKMGFDNVGNFSCKADNTYETKFFNAMVSISGIEPPIISRPNETDVVLQPDKETILQCRISNGKPEPQITWHFKSDISEEFDPVPYDVRTNGETLTFPDAIRERKGTYKCEASNIVGTDSLEFNVIVQYPPRISEQDTAVTVMEGSEVTLTCDVDADPAPDVKWEMIQNGQSIPLEARHIIDERNTLRFASLWKDNADFSCIAENQLGIARKTASVQVLVSPYIGVPKAELIALRSGETLELQCDVQYGNPKPQVFWEFRDFDGHTHTYKSLTKSNGLILKNMQHDKQGFYYCVAKNEVGTDTIKIHVIIM